MRLLLSLVAATLFAAPAMAGCNSPQTTFMACTFNGGKKAVAVCINEGNASYTFGRTGAAPDLALSVPMINLDYVPWPGVSTPFENVTFTNGTVSYSVSAGQSYIYPEDENADIQTRTWGDIEVIENGKVIAALVCDPDSTEYYFNEAMSDAKRAVGLCWEFGERRWETCK